MGADQSHCELLCVHQHALNHLSLSRQSRNQEQVSSVAERPQLEAALDFVREGDVFVVTKLDRLARSVANMLEIVARLERKGVALRILNLGLDTSTPTGRLMLTVMGGVAEFERSMMLERQREGIAKAKAEGVYRGRKPTARAKVDRGHGHEGCRQEHAGDCRGAWDLCRIGARDAQGGVINERGGRRH